MNLFRRKREQPSEATKAREKAERELEQTKAETPKFAALEERLLKRLEQNHLTELFLDIPRRR